MGRSDLSPTRLLSPQLTNCTQAILDCPSKQSAKLYLNPMNPFSDGAVLCQNVTTPLRVFYGERRALRVLTARSTWINLVHPRGTT